MRKNQAEMRNTTQGIKKIPNGIGRLDKAQQKIRSGDRVIPRVEVEGRTCIMRKVNRLQELSDTT